MTAASSMSSGARRPVVLVIRNDDTCPPALVGEWLLEDGLELHVIAADQGEHVPAQVPEGVDAIVPLGGVIGANDYHRAPWLEAERSLLRDAVESGVPVLGICLGGQLLAAAMGGVVTASDTSEVGVTEILRTLDGLGDPVISQAATVNGDTVPAAQWHLDHVAELPDGAVLLMTNPACRVQAFRLGESAYGLQMHPEVDVEVFTSWVADAHENVPRTAVTASEALASVVERQQDLIRAWRPAVRAWGELVWLRSRTLQSDRVGGDAPAR